MDGGNVERGGGGTNIGGEEGKYIGGIGIGTRGRREGTEEGREGREEGTRTGLRTG